MKNSTFLITLLSTLYLSLNAQTPFDFQTAESLNLPSVSSIILNQPNISENGGNAVITATISSAYSEDVTIPLSLTGTAHFITESNEDDFTFSGFRDVITVAGGYTGQNNNALNSSYGHGIDSNNNIYVADTFNNRIMKWEPGASEGIPFPSSGINSFPRTVFIDSSDNIYVVYNNTVTKYDNIGNYVRSYGDIGVHVHVDSDGAVYGVDYDIHSIRKYPAGSSESIIVAGNGLGGPNADQFWHIYGFDVDISGNIYVADRGNGRIQKWGVGATTGTTLVNGLSSGSLYDVVIDSGDNLYIQSGGVHYWNNDTQKLTYLGPGGYTLNKGRNNQIFVNHGNEIIKIIVNPQITIPAGTTIGTITFTGIDDSIFETDETIIVTPSISVTNATSSIVNANTITIINNCPFVSAPTGNAQQSFDTAVTVADLSATGDNLQWYDAATDGNLLDSSAALTNGQVVYASQTVDGCESTERLEVTVVILDTTPPVITLLGADPLYLTQGTTYNEPGATVTDNVDGNIPAVISGNVDTSIPGTYTRFYDAVDTAGNAANQATRTVVVVETTPTVNAGPDQLICEDQTVTLGEATASNYSSLYWTTNGDGAFNNPNIPNTSYTPGPQDRIIESFHLTLNAQGSNGQVYSDTVVIEIEQEHIIELTSSNSDQIVDEGTSISPITFSLGGGATAATISGLPVGISYTLSLGVITIDGVPVDDITTQTVYVYTITTTGNGCTQSTYSGTITVNPEEINPTETGILLNGTVSAENNQIKNVADPTDAQDAVTKTFIENFIKNSVSMEFFEWNISKVNADNQTIQLSFKPFVFVNAANTTIILPDESQVSEMDVIYIYSLRGTNNATIEDCAITFTSNSHPISSYKLSEGLITASVGQKIYGRFPSSGLKTIVFIDGQWFIGNFSPYSILD